MMWLVVLYLWRVEHRCDPRKYSQDRIRCNCDQPVKLNALASGKQATVTLLSVQDADVEWVRMLRDWNGHKNAEVLGNRDGNTIGKLDWAPRW
jgi:hypothetical protein